MQSWVTDKFSPVIDYSVVLPDLGSPHPYPKENLGKLVKFVPVKDKDIMTIVWNLPYMQLDIAS